MAWLKTFFLKSLSITITLKSHNDTCISHSTTFRSSLLENWGRGGGSGSWVFVDVKPNPHHFSGKHMPSGLVVVSIIGPELKFSSATPLKPITMNLNRHSCPCNSHKPWTYKSTSAVQQLWPWRSSTLQKLWMLDSCWTVQWWCDAQRRHGLLLPLHGAVQASAAQSSHIFYHSSHIFYVLNFWHHRFCTAAALPIWNCTLTGIIS